jgi:hypothetical protein
MPVQLVRLPDGRPAWRWGDRGKAYAFDELLEEDSRRARELAAKQGRAIQARKNGRKR